MKSLTKIVAPDYNLNNVIGRSELKAQVRIWAASGSKVLALEGIGGSGKTHILNEVSEAVVRDKAAVRINLDIGSIQNEHQLISKAVKQLRAARPVVDETQISEKIKNISIGQVKLAVLALLKDVVNNAKDTYPALMDELEGVALDIDSDLISVSEIDAMETENLLFTMSQFCACLDQLGIVAVFSIDNFELSDQGTSRAVEFLLKQKPADWVLLLAANTEVSAESIWVEKTRGQFRAHGAHIITVGDLSDEDIRLWHSTFKGTEIALESLAKLVTQSERRAKKVYDLLSDYDVSEGDELPSDYSEIQRKRRARLPADARLIMNILSFTDPDKLLDIKLLEQFFHALDGKEFSIQTEALIAESFLFRQDELVKIAHSSTHKDWQNSISTGEQDLLQAKLIAVIKTLDQDQLYRSRAMVPLLAGKLGKPTGEPEVYETSQRMLQSGETSSAISLLEGVLGMAKAEGIQSIQVDNAILLATANMSLGKYSQAASSIVIAESSSVATEDQLAKIHLLRLKHSLRVNNYETLFAEAEIVKRRFKNDITIQSKRLLIENTAARDILDFDRMRSTVQELKALEIQEIELSIQCSISRSLARTHAKLGNLDESLEYAKTAIDQALRLDNVRPLGNARFAMAEVCRYRNENELALTHYSKAISLAEGMNNRDSLIWSLLGKGYSHLALNQMSEIEETVKKLNPLVNEKGYDHPLESLHAKLLIAITGNPSESDMAELIRNYENLNIKWPKTQMPAISELSASEFVFPL